MPQTDSWLVRVCRILEGTRDVSECMCPDLIGMPEGYDKCEFCEVGELLEIFDNCERDNSGGDLSWMRRMGTGKE